VSKHVAKVRRETLKLVTTLDFRGFGVSAANFFAENPNRNVSETLRRYASVFPCLRCILLDGHPEFDLAPLARPREAEALSKRDFQPPLFLSMAQCHTQLPNTFFESPYLTGLVYLDVSDMAGSLRRPLAQGSLRPDHLPELRILKARGREMDDSTAILLFSTFMDRLWSLDLGRNSLTDSIVTSLISYSFTAASLQSTAHYAAEGRLTPHLNVGSDDYGSFRFIEESEWSATFCHPDRHLADPPVYYPHRDRPPQEALNIRSDGRTPVKADKADAVREILAEGMQITDFYGLDHLNVCHGRGITHLCLSENNLSVNGLERLFRLSQGHLEHFECDSLRLAVETRGLPNWLSQATRVGGVLGASHIFRPVVASNLRSLRIHHSLVTLTPTLKSDTTSAMTNLWLAESFLGAKARVAFPQGFVPDMNPRLNALTLTHVPRYSTGPLIEKLTQFLHLAHKQERAIQQATLSSRHGPSLLCGLRRLRLEFDPDPAEELTTLTDQSGLDLDAGALLDSGADDDFSFFGGSNWGGISTQTTGTPTTISKMQASTTDHNRSTSQGAIHSIHYPETTLLPHYPLPNTQGESVAHTGTWNGNVFAIPVWVGSGALGPHAAVNEYMRRLADRALRRDVRPATPGQVAAGVPAGSYVFDAAWAAIFSWEGVRAPESAELEAMRRRDVVQAIRNYRTRTRTEYEMARRRKLLGIADEGPEHGHWTGRLQIVLGKEEGRVGESSYWR